MIGYLVLDQATRVQISVDVSEIQKHNVQVVPNLKHIIATNSEYSSNISIILLYPFLDDVQNVIELKLFKNLMKYNYILVTNNVDVLPDEIKTLMSEIYELPLLSFAWAECMAVLNGDEETLGRMNIKSTLAQTVLNQVDNQQEVANYLLIDALRSAVFELSALKKKLADETALLLETNKASAIQTLRLKELDTYVDSLFEQAVALNIASNKYELLTKPSVLDRLNLSDYPSHPNILYFKEYGDFLWLNSFLRTLVYVFKMQLHRSVKVLVIGDSYDTFRQHWLAKEFVKFDTHFSQVEVFTSDYLYCSDGYLALLEYLCVNKVGLDYLVIVDKKPVESLVVSQSDIVRFDLIRSISKLNALDIPDSRAIVNMQEDRKLSWNYYPQEFSQLQDVNLLAFLASRPVILELIQACNWFGDKLL